ncbi:MAG: helicase, partial [Anaerolineae bacterium]|nr:helicase [Anaerolineae bacterium]
ILVATDVMSEGQNLQDCGVLVNYDLHWNPMRMVQRAGRIDRLGSEFKTLSIFNLFPESELEALLGLVKSLTAKIDTINQTGFLDASILGEVVTPRDFNTLRRIAQEDNQVIEEQEQFLELASSEMLLAHLQSMLATEAREWLTDLDDGIHSGLERRNARGIFFYFTSPHPEGEGRQHFWRYYDLVRREILDNRYHIMQLIACGPETPRFPPPYTEVDIYDVQEQVIDDILANIEYRQAVSTATKSVSDEQTTAITILGDYANHPDFDRNEIRSLRKFLGQPFVGAHIRRLRNALKDYGASSNPEPLLETLRELYAQTGLDVDVAQELRAYKSVQREDLHLVCYEYIWG